jgi:hypothetical protein
MTDIVERLRRLRFVHVPVASELMEEAAKEIDRLRLTDAEREAVEFFAEIHNEGYGLFAKHTSTLRSLLERLK